LECGDKPHRGALAAFDRACASASCTHASQSGVFAPQGLDAALQSAASAGRSQPKIVLAKIAEVAEEKR